jgi:hypothetical protein
MTTEDSGEKSEERVEKESGSWEKILKSECW